jgi:hypothetical protein
VGSQWQLTQDRGGSRHGPRPVTLSGPAPRGRTSTQQGQPTGIDGIRHVAARASDPLPHRLRLELSFGADLSDIRTDASAASTLALTHEMAHAAALSHRILFDRADPDIETVAHEVTHVLQQRRGGPATTKASENEADDLGRAAAGGKPVSVVQGARADVPQFLRWRNGMSAPTIRHDHGFLDDGRGNLDLTRMRSPTIGDYADLEKWRLKLYAAQVFLSGLADATRAYEHFLNADGSDLTVNYEKFVEDDDSGKVVLASAIDDAKDGARGLDNAWMDAHPYSPVADHNFDMASDPIPVGGGARYPYPRTENWQKAIGAHVIWISAHVDVHEDNNLQRRSMTITMTLHMEDRYNFNPGAHDIVTGTPDNANGVFELTGLGQEFMQYGTVNRVVTWTEPVLTPVGTPATANVGGEPRGGAPRSERHDREGEGPD